MSSATNEWGLNLRMPPTTAAPPKPVFIDPIPEFPQELKDQRIWLVYKAESKANGGTNKIPFNIHGVKCNDKEQDVSFEKAATFLAEHKDEYAGLGLHIPDGYICVDLDDSVDEDGNVGDEAGGIFRQLNSFTEVSPSGRGLHIFARGIKPGPKSRKGNVEIYSGASLRFMSVTGSRVPAAPAGILDRDITPVYNLIAREDSEPKKGSGLATIDRTSSSARLEMGEDGFITSKHEILMNGTVESPKPFRMTLGQAAFTENSTSEAVQVLLCDLAVRHRCDKRKMLEEFEKSNLLAQVDHWRDGKWQRLGESEIGNAIKFVKRAQKPVEIASKLEVKPECLSQSLVTRQASKIKTKTVKWLWQNRFPFGKLSVAAGNPDQGKSLVTMYIAAQLSTGQPLYGCTAALPPCDVLVLAGEDDASDTIVPRLQVMGANLDRIHIAESIAVTDGKGETTERETQLDTDISFVSAKLKENPEIRLIIIDPISNYLGNANMNREQEIRGVLIPLKRLAEQTGVAIISVMHLNKNSEASAIHRISGAMAFSGVARAAWMFVADPKDRDKHMMLRIKGNIAKSVGGLTYTIDAKPSTIEGEETYQPFVTWTGTTDTSPDDLITDKTKNGRPPEERRNAKEWLDDFLFTGEQTAKDVEKFALKAGFAWGTLRRAADDLKVVKYHKEGRSYWNLPPDELAATVI